MYFVGALTLTHPAADATRRIANDLKLRVFKIYSHFLVLPFLDDLRHRFVGEPYNNRLSASRGPQLVYIRFNGADTAFFAGDIHAGPFAGRHQ
jgi:hypothetical protein